MPYPPQGTAMPSTIDASQVISGILSPARIDFAVGDNIIASADAVQSITTPTIAMTKVKQFVAGKSGTLRIVFDLKVANALTTGYGRIYLNGIARGTLRGTTSITYVTYSQDLAVVGGDQVELWIGQAANDAGTVSTQNFRLKSSLAGDSVYARMEIN